MLMLFFVLPLSVWAAMGGVPSRRERVLYLSALAVPMSVAVGLIAAGGLAWVRGTDLGNGVGFQPLTWAGPVLYQSHHGDFALRFFLDGTGALFLTVATLLAAGVLTFSRTYLHRDPGFKRFFMNLTFFYIGLVGIALSDNLETLIIGWEMVGLASFLLISHYRERYLPVRNALRVVGLYRLADVALLLAVWLTHHHFGYGLQFSHMAGQIAQHNASLSGGEGPLWHLALGGLLLLAAAVKGGAFPFSSWVARAMEGPTASSAIFYGALSVHLGMFLLIRTEPLWRASVPLAVVMGVMGVVTAVVAPAIARVQPSVKVQIAYASVGQIGWITLWIALGWTHLALLHFLFNASLRTYQLLVSPSVMSLRMHNLFFATPPGLRFMSHRPLSRLRITGYVLGMKEFGLDAWQKRWLWSPIKRLGQGLGFMAPRWTFALALMVSGIGLYGVMRRHVLPTELLSVLPVAFAAFSLVFVLKAFVEQKSAVQAWSWVAVNQFFLALAMGFNAAIALDQFLWFFSGILGCTLLGLWVLNRMLAQGVALELAGFQGQTHLHPHLALLFLLAGLGLAGFPITPTFVGEDLLLDHVHLDQPLLLFLIAFAWVLDGLVIYRTYARLFLGPDPRTGGSAPSA